MKIVPAFKRPALFIDALIATTASVNGMTVVTVHSVEAALGRVPVINPRDA